MRHVRGGERILFSYVSLGLDGTTAWVKSRIVGISMGPQPEALKSVGIENIERVPLFEVRFLTDQVIY